MPVNLTYSEQAEWPAHLAPIGSGDTKIQILSESHQRRERNMVRSALSGAPPYKPRATRCEISDREVLLGRQREAQLIAEAEREAARRKG